MTLAFAKTPGVGSRLTRFLALSFVLLAVVDGGCGGSRNESAVSPARARAKAASPTGGPSGSAGGPTADASTDAASTKRYLNDGDYERVGDGDGDNSADNDKDPSLDYLPSDYKEGENNLYHDADDRDLLAFGRAASSQQTLAVTAAVNRYYTTAAAGDGAGACSQLSPGIAQAVPTDYGQNGPSYLHAGKTCAAVMTLLFSHYHKQLTAGVAVTGIRISGDEAYALLGSTAFAPSFIIVQHEGNFWKIAELLGTENKLP